MAITLRSTTSVQRSDKISSLLDKIITPGTEAADKQFRQSKASQRSEFESYMERETWSRMKTDREKDMVLLFGDDDVRVFRRNPSNTQKAAKLRSAARGGAVLSKHDLVDVSGLVPVSLDKKIVDTVTGAAGEYVPYSQEERNRIQQRRQEIALRRQQLANQYVFVSQNAAAAAQQQQLSLHQQQLLELGIQLPTDTSQGEEPSVIPIRAWQAWIPRRSDGGKDGKDSAAKDLRQKRRQRRHHRLNCKYHPFSTNADMRRLAIQTSFPRSALHQSIERLQHAANGSQNGEGVRFDVDSCFALVDMQAPPPSNTQKGPLSSTAGFGVGAARQLRKESATPEFSGAPSPLPQLAEDVDTAELSRFSLPSSHTAAQQSFGGTSAFLTETSIQRLSAIDRSSIPPLAPFEKPLRPHSVGGQFVDCECTPRLTDDELDMFGLREAESPTDSPRDKSAPSAKPTGSSPKKHKTLLGSASRAEKRLELWHRDFVASNVHARSGLQSLLDEREERRDFVQSERQHLSLVVREAELSGDDFRVSRRHRCTTPQHASMWTPVFDAIGSDMKHVARNATMFAQLLDYCAELGVPSEAWEKELLETIRAECVSSASVRHGAVSPLRSPNRSRSESRPHSQASSQRPNSMSSSHRRKSSVTVQSYTSASSSSPEKSVFMASSRKPLLATPGDAPVATAFTETLAMSLLEEYGARLLKTKHGTDVANFLRELCGMPNKAFLAFLFAKDSVWEMCPEVHQLQKRIASSGK